VVFRRVFAKEKTKIKVPLQNFSASLRQCILAFKAVSILQDAVCGLQSSDWNAYC